MLTKKNMKALSRTHTHESPDFDVVDVASDILIKLRECILQQKKEKNSHDMLRRKNTKYKERYR